MQNITEQPHWIICLSMGFDSIPTHEKWLQTLNEIQSRLLTQVESSEKIAIKPYFSSLGSSPEDYKKYPQLAEFAVLCNGNNEGWTEERAKKMVTLCQAILLIDSKPTIEGINKIIFEIQPPLS